MRFCVKMRFCVFLAPDCSQASQKSQNNITPEPLGDMTYLRVFQELERMSRMTEGVDKETTKSVTK